MPTEAKAELDQSEAMRNCLSITATSQGLRQSEAGDGSWEPSPDTLTQDADTLTGIRTARLNAPFLSVSFKIL